MKEIRLEQAAKILKNGSIAVENVASSVGYQNVEHFNRQFKKAYGLTPLQYRNQK